ncbi:nucleoside 2-deoxyribosyltransferase [Aquimonas voraii]|uniref:nucleoside 2-deoxyribosyltransferase n=1 Tax=Aquimonas voraii TaxID=265719 RepID=UPI0015A2D2C1|nr:nucleoside 2-deoxyribosyltransferase [Aquimonas voraii]
MVTSRKLYLAAPLFNDLERGFNADLCALLERRFDVFLPQRDGHLLPGSGLVGSEFDQKARQVHKMDVSAMEGADLIFAVLDGRVIDEGVCFEIGFCFALGKRCIALRTDSRVLLPSGINPMISLSLSRIFASLREVESWVEAGAPLIAHNGGTSD